MKQEETGKEAVELDAVRIGNTTDVFDAVRNTTDVEGNAPIGEKGAKLLM